VSPTGRPQRNASLASRGRTVVAAYEEADRVLVARSRDQGAHWDEPVAVAPAGDEVQWWPSAGLGPDGTVWVAWQDGRRVRVAATSAGAAPRRRALRFGPGAAVPGHGGARQWRPALAATGPGQAYVAWVDERGRMKGEDLPQAGIYGAQVAGGSVLEARRLDRADAVAPLAATLDHAWAPSVAARAGRVLVTWIDFRGYDWDVVARESADAGLTFGAERTVNDTPPGAEALEDTPRAALTAAGRPLVAYTDWSIGSGLAGVPSRLYDTNVAGLAAAPVQADDHGPGHVSTFAPALAATPAGDALVAWQDAAGGVARIRMARLRAATGVRGAVLRVDDGGRAPRNRSRPQLTLAGTRAVVAWEDDRDGPAQLYAGRVTVARVP
jgi:hypothetical protein